MSQQKTACRGQGYPVWWCADLMDRAGPLLLARHAVQTDCLQIAAHQVQSDTTQPWYRGPHKFYTRYPCYQDAPSSRDLCLVRQR